MRRGAILLFTAALVAMVMAVGIAERPTRAAAPFTVNSTADSGTGGCDATECTLREAIAAANSAAGADTIEFSIPGAGPHTITPSSALPDITSPVTIDGYTQGDSTPGDPSDDATENTLAVGNNAVLKIELNGDSMPAGGDSLVSGLKIKPAAANSTVKGLIVSDWENGIFLDAGTTDNQVLGNFIGTDVSGTHPGNSGVTIQAGADNNTVGGTTSAARNVISGNNGYGVSLSGAHNKVQGNYIGTNADGAAPLGNNVGVEIDGGADNTIGGTTAAARNVISGNSLFGIRITFTEATGNKVQGNYIGTSAAG